MNEIDLALKESDLVKRIESLGADIEAIQQPRSNYALTHFVVGAHDLPGRQRVQAVLELQIKMFNIRRAQLDEKELIVKRRVQEKKAVEGNEDEIDLAQIEVERINMNIAELRLARLGAIREAECLLSILDKIPSYTYEQLQAEEEEYWKARLSRQALQDLKSTGIITAGNLEAIHQIERSIGDKSALQLEDLKAISRLK